MRLDIGSNMPAAHLTPYEEWRSVDIGLADYVAPMWQLPLPAESIKEIYTSHAMEHIVKAQILPTLLEWYRVLKPEATLTIRVPDLAFCCAQFLVALQVETEEHPVIGWHLDMLYGNQEREGQVHQTGYTKNSLCFYVKQAGFTIQHVGVIWSHNQQTIELIAVKPIIV